MKETKCENENKVGFCNVCFSTHHGTSQTTADRFRELWGTSTDGSYWNDPDCSAKTLLAFIEEEKERAYQKGREEMAQKIHPAMELARREEREELIDKAWEYCVKASREEMGSKEELIKSLSTERNN